MSKISQMKIKQEALNIQLINLKMNKKNSTVHLKAD